MGTVQVPFGIGDTVWKCGHEYQETWIECPDCAGTRAITLVLGNGTQQSMDCNRCQIGYDRPSGMVKHVVYDSQPTRFVCRRIVGWTDGLPDYTESEECESGYSYAHSKDLYTDKAECEKACAERNAERKANDERIVIANIASKRRSLAFSSHYWAGKVKTLERELEAARARLAACKQPRTPKGP